MINHDSLAGVFMPHTTTEVIGAASPIVLATTPIWSHYLSDVSLFWTFLIQFAAFISAVVFVADKMIAFVNWRQRRKAIRASQFFESSDSDSEL